MNQEPTPAKGRLTDGLGADCESFGALICEAEEPPEGRVELRRQHGEIKSMQAERRHTERRLLAVEAQRDALLEALKELTPPMPPADAPCHVGLVPQEKCAHCGRIARARACIKAVEETK